MTYKCTYVVTHGYFHVWIVVGRRVKAGPEEEAERQVAAVGCHFIAQVLGGQLPVVDARQEALGVAVHQLLLLDAQALCVGVEQAAVRQLEAVRVAASGSAELRRNLWTTKNRVVMSVHTASVSGAKLSGNHDANMAQTDP